MPGPGFSGALNELTRAGSSCDRGKPKAVMKTYLRRLAQTLSPEFYSWYQAYRFRQWVRSSYGGPPEPLLERLYFIKEKFFLVDAVPRVCLMLANLLGGVLPQKPGPNDRHAAVRIRRDIYSWYFLYIH